MGRCLYLKVDFCIYFQAEAFFCRKSLFKKEAMDEKNYTVSDINGEYAILKDEYGEELFIALALLPSGIDIGTKLKYEFPDFTVVE